jgi:hypothetical protein
VDAGLCGCSSRCHTRPYPSPQGRRRQDPQNYRPQRPNITTANNWADDYITTANVWEVAYQAWHYGRRQTRIPALVDANGDLTFDHDSMSSIFADRFFARDPGDIPLNFPDDPPARPTRTFAPITADEAFALLSRTSNTSSPRDSGIGWALLKRGWGPASETLTCNLQRLCHVGPPPGHVEECSRGGHTQA